MVSKYIHLLECVKIVTSLCSSTFMLKYQESKSLLHCLTQKFLKSGKNPEPQHNFDEYRFYMLTLDNLLDIANSASSMLKIS